MSKEFEEIRYYLFDRLKAERSFWSYKDVSYEQITDDMLIEMVLLHLDLPDSHKLFKIFSFKKIKKVWLRHLVPLGDWFYDINRLYSWYFFKIKRPDTYLKSMETRYLNSLS